MSPKQTQDLCDRLVSEQLDLDIAIRQHEGDLYYEAEARAERGPSCEDWGPPSDHSGEGYDCCRNQGSPFCSHGGGW